ncbi:M15 family metallopeptidase [Janibacter melonis]|uniref:M15 family metallopeptidase n=1 Tax=Janibacter melonis TaxID=262209 RepID=UPI002095F756|nr:M15 family metallopeptidase [Janibacter melonis]
MNETAVEVIYPQYGGMTPDRRHASVMVVLDVIGISAPDARSRRTSMTLDVRLRKGHTWQVREVLIPQTQNRAATVPQEVQDLLSSQRIDLPRMARLDLVSNRVAPELVTVMTALTRRWHLSVQVLRAGHPENVFATNRRSNHSLGRAVDLWALDRVPVIDHDRSPWRRVMEAAAELGANEVGGPVDLAGPAFFTDLVHQDHLHVAVESKTNNNS